MDAKKILENILDVYNINATELAEKINVQRSGLSHIMTGRNNLSLDFIVKIKNTFPELRWEFLIHGKLPMFEREENKKSNIERESEKNENRSPNLFDEIQQREQIQDKKEIFPQGLKKIEQIVIFYTDGSFKAYNDKSL